MAVSMFAWQNIFAFSKRTKIVLLNKADRQIAVLRLPAALICKKEVFRKGVGFVPGIGDALVWTSALLRPA